MPKTVWGSYPEFHKYVGGQALHITVDTDVHQLHSDLEAAVGAADDPDALALALERMGQFSHGYGYIRRSLGFDPWDQSGWKVRTDHRTADDLESLRQLLALRGDEAELDFMDRWFVTGRRRLNGHVEVRYPEPYEELLDRQLNRIRAWRRQQVLEHFANRGRGRRLVIRLLTA